MEHLRDDDKADVEDVFSANSGQMSTINSSRSDVCGDETAVLESDEIAVGTKVAWTGQSGNNVVEKNKNWLNRFRVIGDYVNQKSTNISHFVLLHIYSTYSTCSLELD